VFRYIYENEKKESKTFTEDEARTLWDSFIYLKLKCPTLDIQNHLTRIESFMPRDDTLLTEGAAEVSV
jgi:hypothetical protein